MDAQVFKNRMGELAAMVRNDQSMELFADSYELLLNEISVDDDRQRRQEHAARMKRLLLQQAAYLMNAHIKYQKMVQGPYSTRMQ